MRRRDGRGGGGSRRWKQRLFFRSVFFPKPRLFRRRFVALRPGALRRSRARGERGGDAHLIRELGRGLARASARPGRGRLGGSCARRLGVRTDLRAVRGRSKVVRRSRGGGVRARRVNIVRRRRSSVRPLIRALLAEDGVAGAVHPREPSQIARGRGGEPRDDRRLGRESSRRYRSRSLRTFLRAFGSVSYTHLTLPTKA